MDQRKQSVTDRTLEQWMNILLLRAEQVGEDGEVPVSAVVLDRTGRCIGHGRNRREFKKDPLGHAELIALRQAALILDDWRFNGCTLIVTLEPCPMCAGAAFWTRIGRVVYGAKDDKRGHSKFDGELTMLHPKTECQGGLLADESAALLTAFFRAKR